MEGLQPLEHRDVAVLEDRADLDREGLVAVVALLDADAGALALQRLDAVRGSAMRADRTIRPEPSLDPLICGVFVVEAGMAQDGHGHLLCRGEYHA
jgi:hypothetical protein